MSLKIRLIPCLDVKDGKVVKGINFVNLRDAGDPVEIAERYDREGADELCFLDIAASNESRQTLYELVSKTADKCFMPVTVGGGVRTIENIGKLLRAGADKVSINSAATQDPEFIARAADKFGNQCITASIDAKRVNGAFKIFTHGGSRETEIDAIEFAELAVEKGAGEILLTSMDKDGTKSGYNLELIKAVADNVNVPVIASGGVGTLDHLVEGIKAGADAVLAASIFHFGTYTIKQAKTHMAQAGLPVRMDV